MRYDVLPEDTVAKGRQFIPAGNDPAMFAFLRCDPDLTRSHGVPTNLAFGDPDGQPSTSLHARISSAFV